MTFYAKQVSIIRGMLKRGDKQHDVAAWFSENQARIVEAEQGKFGVHEAAPVDELPPRGAPGPKGQKIKAFAEKALSALEAGNVEEARKHLVDGIARYNKNE
jgi:hypothetical protein